MRLIHGIKWRRESIDFSYVEILEKIDSGLNNTLTNADFLAL